MKLIILKFHIFYTYFTIKKILEINKKQNKNLKQNLTGKLWKQNKSSYNYRTKGINQRGHPLQQMRKLTSFITETFWAVTHHNLY